MDRDEVEMISKKPRLTKSTAAKYVENVVYRLYFKGLVSDDTEAAQSGKKTAMAGFGIAVCDQTDELLFEIKEPVSNPKIDLEGVEARALVRGLSESLHLGISKVVIYCFNYQLYQNIITGECNPILQERDVRQLMEQVQRLRQKFESCEAILVGRKDIKFPLKLAREAIDSQTSSSSVSEVKGEICCICREETDTKRMFAIEECHHRHCYSCVNHYVEVKLHYGNVPKCLNYECKLELTLENCSKVLEPKVIELWKQKMEEDSIPVEERIYCPYPNCSKLMSKTAISRSDKSNDGVCVKCCRLFCIDCKVPSHSDLSCAEYKKLHLDRQANDLKFTSLANHNKWRQCSKCRHMIELNQGCNHMTCRCGYQFCYKCGVEWKNGQVRCPTCFPVTGLLMIMLGIVCMVMVVYLILPLSLFGLGEVYSFFETLSISFYESFFVYFENFKM